jgi:hypothetical protein
MSISSPKMMKEKMHPGNTNRSRHYYLTRGSENRDYSWQGRRSSATSIPDDRPNVSNMLIRCKTEQDRHEGNFNMFSTHVAPSMCLAHKKNDTKIFEDDEIDCERKNPDFISPRSNLKSD